MKYLKVTCFHLATVLAGMVTVFLCIHFVNPAMAFYDHVYTKALLLAVCLLLVVNAFLAKKERLIRFPLLLLALLLAAAEAFLCLSSFFVPDDAPFVFLPAQLVALCLCLCSLVLSVTLTAITQK